MSDAADLAAIIADETLASALAKISPDIPAGTAGVCDECGELMPRLVGDRCGFCRDGRRPPLSRFESLPVPEVLAMSDYISVPADPAVRKVITDRARRESLPLGHAALAFIKEALERAASPAVAIDTADLATVPAHLLAAEIARRVTASVSAEQLDAANARAAAAEGQLANFRQQLSGVLAQAAVQ